MKVWEKSHKLTPAVYEVVASFPRYELYGLTSQLRRSAASVPSNIAEGCGRGSNHLDLLDPPEYENLAKETIEVRCMLAAFIRSLRAFNRQQKDPKPDA